MDFRRFLPHLIAVGVLMLVSLMVFSPNAFQGKVLPQQDNDNARGMQTETRRYLDTEGKAPLWTNSAFGGMPGYQIYADAKGNLTIPVFRAVFLWSDVGTVWIQVFVAMVFMYLFLLVLGIDWRVGLIGALGYGITSYHVDILEAGHTTKMLALALAPAIFAGAVLLYRGNFLSGGSLMGLALALQIHSSHVQITYYSGLLLVFLAIFSLLDAVRSGALKQWAIASGIALAASGLAFAANLPRLWTTYEYTQETIRGRSELSSKSAKGDGLDKDYLFGWSYGIGESLTLLVPHYAGGGAGESPASTKLFKALSKQMPPGTTKRQMERQVSALLYSGEQPFVGTAIYFGAALIFLAILGVFLSENRARWWLLTGGVFTIILAWGKHFFLNDLFFDVLPLFNKFRAVSMALGMGQLCFAALAAIGVQAFMSMDSSAEEKKRALFWSAGIAASGCLLALLSASTTGPNDEALAQNPDLLRLLEEDRAAMVRSDVMRSLAMIGIAFTILSLYLTGRLRAALGVFALSALILADHWGVVSRTLTADKWVNKKTATAPPAPEAFDQQIQQDPDIHYRVLDLSRGGITGNATTSYFHKSLSGYHAAKLQRFQDVVDMYLNAKLGENLHIVGMMNGKYIVTQQKQVIPNTMALGHAWFVQHITAVATPDDELQALGSLNPKDTALIAEAYLGALRGFQPTADTNATIELISYHPDKMVYKYSAATDQFAVFPEMYYPPSKGWSCYVDGERSGDFTKVDYLLRGMRLPAGKERILEMRFEPRSFYVGEKVSLIGSILLLIAAVAALFFWYRSPPAPSSTRLVNMDRPPSPVAASTAEKGRKTGKGR